jgi:hypothetical protein
VPMTEDEYARKMEVIRIIKEMMSTVITARTGILYNPSCFIEYGRKDQAEIKARNLGYAVRSSL